ncbi:MAG: bifunctional folylpolyglutamate synthase/dihydrofolate synthase [Chloroflexi bacterium]|nr:bifunctional folylpolyglutamate synthase/dihydrofolate synthase [Chloroflexota bacterium]MCL5075089.1 bifunctional folylpolyglutamate synthase/dihydrofolate synthase [Chloroflexota bacterium]
MNYEEALNYIYSFTDYERTTVQLYGAPACNLERTEHLLNLLGNPQHHYQSIHIAGTKGKGSTAAMIASVMEAAGYKVALYTSPHLHSFRERIRTNQHPIPGHRLSTIISQMRPLVDQVHSDCPDLGRLTTFEVSTALAFTYFATEAVDFAVIEVGMGGRLDATNVLRPLVSIITSISLDHVPILGDTLPQIAAEKAGIIKDNGLVVSAPQRPEVLAVLEETCHARKARLFLIGQDWRWEARAGQYDWKEGRLQSFDVQGPFGEHKGLEIPLLGRHQLVNATTAVAALELLREYGLTIDALSIRQGLRQVIWPGRLEVVSWRPLLVLDGAHNADSAEKLLAALQEGLHYKRLILILGTSAGKDIPGIIRALAPAAELIITTQSKHPRAADPQLLQQEGAKYGCQIRVVEDVQAALDVALDMADEHDLICVTGSLFVVAEARESLGRAPHAQEMLEVLGKSA